MITIKIFLGYDHQGVKCKDDIINYLNEFGYIVETPDIINNDNDDYPDYAKWVCEHVLKEHSLGILVCGSGIGMSIVANKFKGIRCAKCNDEEEARLSRAHNDSNILALGADYIETDKAIRMVRMWIATEFEGGRHQERVKLIEEIENENMK